MFYLLFSLHPDKAIQESKTLDICPTNFEFFQCRGSDRSAYNCYLVFQRSKRSCVCAKGNMKNLTVICNSLV